MNAPDDAARLRAPPHSVEAEQSVLGALLLDNSTWDRAADLLTESDFYRLENRLIFCAIAALLNAGKPADAVTVFEQLRDIGRADDTGGLAYLNALAASVPSAANLDVYAERVRAEAMRRGAIAASDAAAARAFAGADPLAVIEEARAALDRLEWRVLRPKKRPAPLDFAALATEAAPPRHWYRPGWLTNGATLLSGGGGAGKSMLLQHEATAAGLGRAYFAPPAEPYRSLAWLCEDDEPEVWRRQERICRHELVGLEELADRLWLVSRCGADNALMAEIRGQLVPTRLLEELRQQVNDLAIDMLWLDNAAHVLLANHDDRVVVTTFINALNGLVQGRPFGVAIVTHTARSQGSEYGGSAAWENACRTRLYLGTRLPDQREQEVDEAADTSTRFLCRRKANYSARDYVRMHMSDGLLLPDETPSAGGVSSIVSAIDERKAEDILIAGFRTLEERGIRTTDGRTSSDYLPAQIVSKGLAGGYSKPDMVKALNRLLGRGRFVRGQIGQYANRLPRTGLVLQPEV